MSSLSLLASAAAFTESRDAFYATLESHGINSRIADAAVKGLLSDSEYANIPNRNILVAALADYVNNHVEQPHCECNCNGDICSACTKTVSQVRSVFASAGPTHDALQTMLDAWLDMVDEAGETDEVDA
jgi:hypothetical protein